MPRSAFGSPVGRPADAGACTPQGARTTGVAPATGRPGAYSSVPSSSVLRRGLRPCDAVASSAWNRAELVEIEQPDVTLRLSRTVLGAVMSRATTFARATGEGRAEAEADARVPRTFGMLTDRPDPRFPIVTP
ncbi:alkyl sulfatase C-terminal domain-containing protein [Streptomyces pratensis]|uniref:alkyl sulfatase C-terminal domain-containing protein n=1 Tax=Streptomyces pratensis TaxID=1169025 RepID=UPI001931B665|nr:alkyl sulfatase C-terminal domain-containing protein [Streptomyces pratensis]